MLRKTNSWGKENIKSIFHEKAVKFFDGTKNQNNNNIIRGH